MDIMTEFLIHIINIFIILAITTATFYSHPVITSIIIIINEIICNVHIITLSHIYVPPHFIYHMSKLCILFLIEYMCYIIFGSYILVIFTLLKINYFFVKTSLAEIIYGKNLEGNYVDY